MRFLSFFFASLLSKIVFRYRKATLISLIGVSGSIASFVKNPKANAPKVVKSIKTQEKKMVSSFNSLGKYLCSNVYGKSFLGVQIPKMRKVCQRIK